MKRTKKNRQAECLQTGKSERTAANAAKCANGYGQEKTGSDFRKEDTMSLENEIDRRLYP